MLQNIEEKSSGNAVHNQLKSQSFTGLSETEAATRLVTEGYNEIPASVRKGFFSTAVDVIREPMFLLLFACGAVYMVLGDVQEALMLLAFVFFVVALTLYQERKTEHALEALRDLSSPRALVIRDGSERRIAGREVVRDDILILSEGDRIPADAEILQSLNLLVDESLLTGESVPVSKSEENFMYSGTMVVQGQGIARVYATGVKTELGKISKILQTLSQEETLLQKETSQWVRILSILGISLCFLVITFFGILHADWLNGVLTGITLAMAILPEELPVVLVIFLAMGAWRISKKQVLTRKMPAIETLGATSVLCVDKTGTLTMNRMSVKKLFSGEDFIDVDKTLSATLPEKFHALLEFGTLASQLNPFDPMEKAIKMLADQRLDQQKLIHQQLDFLHEFPLSKEQLSVSRAWKSPESDTCIIAAKGAPEAIINLCHFDEEQTARMTKLIEVMADEGLRILGVASAYCPTPDFAGKQHDIPFEFLGFIGLSDPVRSSVPSALAECYKAGIRIVMITGDYAGTACTIARQIGLKNPDLFITGPEFQTMTDQELQERIKNVNIFARVVPEQKLRLVHAFKANNEIVAMTGDGVNDAPALKAANIGLAMGARGSDVA